MSIKDILNAIQRVEATPLGRGVELRMSFSQLVIRRLRELGWTQKKLADASGKYESYISRVLNCDENCSFDRIAEIIFALKTKVEFQIVEEQQPDIEYRVTGANGNQTTGNMIFKEAYYGQKTQDIEWTSAEVSARFKAAKSPRVRILETPYFAGH